MHKHFLIHFLLFAAPMYLTAQSHGHITAGTDTTRLFTNEPRMDAYYNSLKFWDDFSGLDTSGKAISKAMFLQAVSTGNYFPLQLNTSATGPIYKLIRIDSLTPNISAIRALAYREYRYQQMIGKPLPGFNFKGLDGNTYNQQTTKGKIIAIKCWFIACVPCVAEMPALNEFVSRYKTRGDIVFLSLAYDSAGALKTFLAKKPFSYTSVAAQQDYLNNVLGIDDYPTHIIINKKGVITKIVSDYRDMEEEVVKETVND